MSDILFYPSISSSCYQLTEGNALAMSSLMMNNSEPYTKFMQSMQVVNVAAKVWSPKLLPTAY
jgi:hypothetical protein